jgi:hypothetical protein
MLLANIAKKWNIKLTIVDQYTGTEEKVIGQLWEYLIPGHKEPDHFHFCVRNLPEFEGIGIYSDGNDDKHSLLESVKSMYQRRLKQYGFINEKAKLLFSLLPVEQVF